MNQRVFNSFMIRLLNELIFLNLNLIRLINESKWTYLFIKQINFLKLKLINSHRME